MAEKITERKQWDFAIKNSDGEIETTVLNSTTFEPDVDPGSFISQAAPTIIRPSRRRKAERADTVTLDSGDAQIGYYENEPFHDERAMGAFVMAVVEVQPDNICLLGDMLDLPPMSKFDQRAEWQQSTQKSIDRYHSYLAELRANAPDAHIKVLHGNHEERMPKMLRRDAAELMGLKRANAEKELGVLTLGYLCRYGELEIEAYTGYPNGAFWLEDNIRVTHGDSSKKGGYNAARYLNNEANSVIYGHSHRMEIVWRTRATRLGGMACVAASPGCLARTDGTAPGHLFTTDESGILIPRSEDWQQGALMILHNERNHDVQPLRISERGINIGGNYYAHQ